MSIPVNAQVSAAPNFAANLAEASAFFKAQDAASAVERTRKLKAGLREMTRVLRWAPTSGRPARFLNAQSVQAQLRAEAVVQLAREVGLPHLREFVVDPFVVLYAHGEAEVVLLAIKHHRQLAYSAAQ